MQVEIPPTRHGSVKTSRNRLPYPVAGCFIFPRLYLTSVEDHEERPDPRRWLLAWTFRAARRKRDTRFVDMRTTSLVRKHMCANVCLPALLPSISFSLASCFSCVTTIRQTKLLCRCPTRFIEFGPFRASLTKIAGE